MDALDSYLAGADIVRVFFGPPASGKSTWVARAGRAGFDLEVIPSSVMRTALVRCSDHDLHPACHFRVIGAADTQVADWRRASDWLPSAAVCILLLPDQDTLRQRRIRRDAEMPWKAGQADFYSSFSRDREVFDYVVEG